MNLKDILVHIDSRPTCASRLEVAVRLACQQQSRLTGIYVIPRPSVIAGRKDTLEQAEEAQQRFRQATTAAGLESDWICVDSSINKLDVANAINLYAHYHDLLVISQTDEDAQEYFIPANLPERAVLGSGRPVLIVPYAGSYKHDYKRILLA